MGDFVEIYTAFHRNVRSRSSAFHVVAEFSRSEGPALEQITDRIRAYLRLLGLGMRTMVLAFAGRPVAELARPRIVPPRCGIIGRAVENIEADVGMLQHDAEELHDVLRRDPDRQAACIERPRADIADPETSHDHAVLVGIERAQRLAERLADAVAAVGAHRKVGADLAPARIEADRVIGRSEDHALDAGLPRRLEEVVAADDVGLQDRLCLLYTSDAADE